MTNSLQIIPVSQLEQEIRHVSDRLVAIAYEDVKSRIGKGVLLFQDMNVYLQKDPQLFQEMYELAIHYFYNLALEEGIANKKGILPIDLEAVEPELLVLAMFADFNVLLGITEKEDRFHTAFFTRDRNLFEAMSHVPLASNPNSSDLSIARALTLSHLVPECKYYKPNAAKYTKAFYTALAEGKHTIYRMDVVGTSPTNVVAFDLVRTQVKPGDAMSFVPITLIDKYLVDTFIVQRPNLFKFQVFRNGIVETKKATFSKELFTKTYASADMGLINMRLKNIRIGYNVATRRIHAYHLETSLTTSIGEASFRPEFLIGISQAKVEEIDKSIQTIDRHLYRLALVSMVNSRMFPKDISTVVTIPGTVVTQGENNKKILVNYADKLNTKDFVRLVEHIADVLETDLNTLLAKHKKRQRTFSPPVPVDLSELPIEAHEPYLRQLMDSGVVYFTAYKKDGSVFNRRVSNHVGALTTCLGTDYVQNYETPQVRIRAFKEAVENMKEPTPRRIVNLIRAYHLEEHIAPSDTVDGVLAHTRNAMAELVEKAATRSRSEGSVLYRDLDTVLGESLYGTVNVSKLINVFYSNVI